MGPNGDAAGRAVDGVGSWGKMTVDPAPPPPAEDDDEDGPEDGPALTKRTLTVDRAAALALAVVFRDRRGYRFLAVVNPISHVVATHIDY